jgi:membrane protease YdiL (CAAX protease family)
MILWRLNWLGISGVYRKGDWRAWLIAMIALLYLLPTKLYAFTGSISFNFGNIPQSLGNLANYFAGAMVEEIMYRGIILTAMVLVWGNSRVGLAKALLISSLMFGALHLLNLTNTPVLEVLMQVVVVIIPGFFYAVLVQIGGSIWPAVLVHWLTNAVVNIQLSSMSDYDVQLSNWFISGLLLLPLLVASIILFNRFVKAKNRT